MTENANEFFSVASELKAELEPLGKKYYIETYGCQMNVRDSETIGGLLQSCGYTLADNKNESDLILFNTCCIRDHAEKRVFGNIGALKEAKEAHPSMIIGVCGCMMEQDNVAKKLQRRFPFVDLVFGTNVLHRLPEMIKHVLEGDRVCLLSNNDVTVVEGLPSVRDVSTSAYVNIMYGCNNFCSYCIVPYVRGRERSRSVDAIVNEIEQLVSKGYTEITLLGQNVNSYGNDTRSSSFAELLTVLNQIEGLKRIRFMSSHPKDLSDAVIDAIRNNPKVCHHVHLPVQSGSDRILKAMNRKYTREQYLDIVHKLRSVSHDFELTTDVIVGFPGETEDDFLQTLSLIKEVGYSAAFTFKYSKRQGTKAATMEEQVDEAEKKLRLKRLNDLQAEMTVTDNMKYIDHIGEVLVEGYDQRETCTVFGKLSNFKMVYFRGDPDLVGKYVNVRITACKKNSLIGEIV